MNKHVSYVKLILCVTFKDVFLGWLEEKLTTTFYKRSKQTLLEIKALSAKVLQLHMEDIWGILFIQ